MKVVVYSARTYDTEYLDAANKDNQFSFQYIESALTVDTVEQAKGADAVCLFVNDNACSNVLSKLHEYGIRMIALRCAGYNNVDLEYARQNGVQVMNVPAYSPYAVAEHAITLMLTLNRGVHIAHQRILKGDYSLDGLMGFDMHARTVGLIGVGKIGTIAARILTGFGCHVIATDPVINQECIDIGVKFISIDDLLTNSDIVSLHAPLNDSTHYLINKNTIAKMKNGVMLINTGRGALVNTCDVIAGIETGKIGYFGLDVYENEAGLFFCNHSNEPILDECLHKLKCFPNVLMTGHQAFLTREAMINIACTTLTNLSDYQHGRLNENLLT